MPASAIEAPELPAKGNVELIGALEREASLRRSWVERLSDGITRYTGTLGFLLLHVMVIAAWFGLNLELVPGVAAFDPFPFGVLTLIVSAEGVFLAIFVLISQNRMMRDADRRAHLGLQLSLLTEQNSTKVLQLLQTLAEQLGVPEALLDAEARTLALPTDIKRIAEELDRSLPK